MESTKICLNVQTDKFYEAGRFRLSQIFFTLSKRDKEILDHEINDDLSFGENSEFNLLERTPEDYTPSIIFIKRTVLKKVRKAVIKAYNKAVESFNEEDVNDSNCSRQILWAFKLKNFIIAIDKLLDDETEGMFPDLPIGIIYSTTGIDLKVAKLRSEIELLILTLRVLNKEARELYEEDKNSVLRSIRIRRSWQIDDLAKKWKLERHEEIAINSESTDLDSPRRFQEGLVETSFKVLDQYLIKLYGHYQNFRKKFEASEQLEKYELIGDEEDLRFVIQEVSALLDLLSESRSSAKGLQRRIPAKVIQGLKAPEIEFPN